MKKGKLFAGFASMLAAGALALGLVATPASATEASVAEGVKAEIQKTVYANHDIDISNDAFIFTAEALGTVDTTTGAITENTTDMPAIAQITIDNITNTGVISTKTGEFTITGLDFPRAGVYAYTIAETPGNDATITYAQEEYVMFLYVNNTVDSEHPDGTLEITQVFFVQSKDAQGEPIDYTKDSEKAHANFTNVHEPVSNLFVSKQVAGAYGDKTQDFLIDIAVTLPNNYTDEPSSEFYTIPDSFTATYVTTREDHSHEPITLTKGEDGKYTGVLVLADGEKVEIDNLPVGATYTIKEEEEPVPGYLATYEYASSADDNRAIGETRDAQTAVITNEYQAVTPTGILMNALPYMVLIGIPVGALVGYVVVRSKRYAQGA